MTTPPLLDLERVSKRFVKPIGVSDRIANLLGARHRAQVVHAVDEVSLSVRAGEIVGLVGESGCGKSTLGRIVAGIHAPSDGHMRWQGRRNADMTPRQKREAQLAVQMIFQDPMSSLNPRLRVADIVGEAPVVHGLVAKAGMADYVDTLFASLGLPHEPARGRAQIVHDAMRAREVRLLRPLMDYLSSRNSLRVLGPAEAKLRAPTIAIAANRPAEPLASELASHGVLAGGGDFYSPRPLEAMGIDPDIGVLRLSFTHYTSEAEIDRAITALDHVL